MGKDNRWTTYSEDQLSELNALAEDYKSFMTTVKTEREAVCEVVKRATKAGYRSLDEIVEKGECLKAGDKVYAVWMKKTMALFTVGTEPIQKGIRILGAHIDSPRLDLKQVPLYENTEMAFLDTHYYGGVKKYQWTTVPLAIHGVIAKKDGTVVDVQIGEDENDPVFCVTDLLIHLSSEQMTKKLGDAITGENLDVLVGSRPIVIKKDEDGQAASVNMDGIAKGVGSAKNAGSAKDSCSEEAKELVKKNVLAILKEKYGMEEDDFLSAELEIVPAGKARDMGIDRSMIACYGQDDRVCAFTSLDAFLRVENPKHTTCCLLTDKEEIGSVGATGAQSHFFENAVAELMDRCGQFSELALRRALASSRMLSSDVSAAFDPLYADAYEKRNAAYFGHGIVYNKYTGSRGKSGSNDANAEYFAWVRRAMDDADVAFQTAELGKVDIGGGGTIAFISALYGMNVVDAGIAVLNMHAPLEVTSKSDLYEARNAYVAFLTAEE
ncbi:MAG TPA: aminopeptidase [Lachnospiraceae bacterium]|nr:aminopeptidase [Lachnospiraceae bacterium]